MTPHRVVVLLVSAASLLGFGLGFAAHVVTDDVPVRPWYAEDDPRWDCRLDGNRECDRP
jgi:hypothetical protein